MKKDALSHKPAGLRVVDILKLILILSRVVQKEGLLSMEDMVGDFEDIPEYLREFVLLIVDGADPDYIVEYGSIHYYMSSDRGERFKIFFSLYLILLLQLGGRDCMIWYIAKHMLNDDERQEMSELDAKRNEKLGPGKPRSIHDIDRLYLSQDDINTLLNGFMPDEVKEKDKQDENVS
ncbi:MAG: hypothetical protein K6G83_08370 [Lachnospiraceae bacterium]|nr:hypothetical protein [Lachnospiraceae bacterium]